MTDIFRLAVLTTASVVTTVSLGLAQAPPSVAHEFFGMGAVVDKANQAVQLAAMRLKGSFGVLSAS